VVVGSLIKRLHYNKKDYTFIAHQSHAPSRRCVGVAAQQKSTQAPTIHRGPRALSPPIPRSRTAAWVSWGAPSASRAPGEALYRPQEGHVSMKSPFYATGKITTSASFGEQQDATNVPTRARGTTLLTHAKATDRRNGHGGPRGVRVFCKGFWFVKGFGDDLSLLASHRDRRLFPTLRHVRSFRSSSTCLRTTRS
jgi:hypothetical protein